MADALDGARREALAYFGQPDVYVERYITEPRHIEVQVMGDHHGCLVHLGERDCSVQRRHQKLIEESPSAAMNPELRMRMGEMALRVAGSVDYSSAGTVEFLLAPDDEFYFLEMNTRIQVEHPVTEWVTGADLIQEMILAAAGDHITLTKSIEELRGHAIEVRINAEDPSNGFRPTPATISRYREPGGPGTRVDSGVYAGFTIPGDYDSLMSKLICWAPDRERARRRTLRALREYEIDGPSTTIPFHISTLQHQKFISGKVSTSFLDEHALETGSEGVHSSGNPLEVDPETWRDDPKLFEIEVDRRVYRVRVAEIRSRSSQKKHRTVKRAAARTAARQSELVSPMHGTVIGIKKREGDSVQSGDLVMLIEAMKMENEVIAHRPGTVTAILADVGETVETDQPLARIE